MYSVTKPDLTEIYLTGSIWSNRLFIICQILARRPGGSKPRHIHKLFTKLNILTICSFHKIQLATHMYKILHKLIPDHSTFSFPQNSSIHAHNTSFNQLLHISYSRTKLRNDTIRFQGPELWNSLPSHLGESERLCNFKRQLRIFIMKQQSN